MKSDAGQYFANPAEFWSGGTGKAQKKAGLVARAGGL